MPKFFNQYSYIWITGLLVVLIGFLLFRREPQSSGWLALVVIIVVLLAAWFALRPRQTPLMGEAAQVKTQIGGGSPVLLEFQSSY